MVTLTSKISDSERMESPRLAVASLMHLARMTPWCALPSVGPFGVVFIDGTGTLGLSLNLIRNEFDPILVGYIIPLNSAWFNKMVPDLKLAMHCFAFFMAVSRTAQAQNKRTQTSMPSMGFEPTISVLERAKTVHALDRAAAVIGRAVCYQVHTPRLQI
jgi:hypothetical protein